MLPYHATCPQTHRIRSFGSTLQPRYVFGATSLDQLQTDIDGCLLKLSDAVLKDIEELHLTYPNPCP